MTRDQKRKLAMIVLARAADIVEYWDEIAPELAAEGVDSLEAAACLTAWLKRLPTGDGWDVRLPDPLLNEEPPTRAKG